MSLCLTWLDGKSVWNQVAKITPSIPAMKVTFRAGKPLRTEPLVKSIRRIAGIAKQQHRPYTLREETARDLFG